VPWWPSMTCGRVTGQMTRSTWRALAGVVVADRHLPVARPDRQCPGSSWRSCRSLRRCCVPPGDA